MGKIYIESKEVDAPFNIDRSSDHLYLVYQDDNGNETIIRGGWHPFNDLPEAPNLEYQINIPIESSEDARGGQTPEQRGRVELNLYGRSAESVWVGMMETTT